MKWLKPALSRIEYLLNVYKCPYCEQEWSEHDLEKHMEVCKMYHKKRSSENYSKAAKIRERGKRGNV